MFRWRHSAFTPCSPRCFQTNRNPSVVPRPENVETFQDVVFLLKLGDLALQAVDLILLLDPLLGFGGCLFYTFHGELSFTVFLSPARQHEGMNIQRFRDAFDTSMGLVAPLHRFHFELATVLLRLLPRDHCSHRSSPSSELAMRVHYIRGSPQAN